MEIADFLLKLISRMRYMCLMFVLVAHGIIAEYHLSAASAIVKFDSNNSLKTNNNVRNRRMYAMCPPTFQRIGAECYSIVELNNNWLEAHFYCKDKNAKLAEPQSISDRKLRSYLQSFDQHQDPIWIGIAFDWKSNVWRTSIKGKAIKYQSFNMDIGDQHDLQNKCAVYDPTLNYSWSARPCSDKYRFICQHKMPKVSERNRQKVYDRWNVTYPNKFANEVLLRVVDRGSRINGNIRRSQPIDSGNNEQRFYNKYQDPSMNEVSYKNSFNNTETQPAPGVLQVLNSPKRPVEKPLHTRKNHYDRKLQRQREREKLRSQQRLERLEKKRRRLEKLKRRGEKNNPGRKKVQHPENLTQYPTPFASRASFQGDKQTAGKEIKPKESNKIETPIKNENEISPPIDEKMNQNENQRLREENRLQQEREERMRQSQIEADNLQKKIEDEKRYRDEFYRSQLEEEEKRRQAEQQKKFEEEEKKLKMLELEKQSTFEKQELERIRAEQLRREELERNRMLEIAKRKEIQRKRDEEEERLRKELELTNETYEKEHQEKIRREEEEAKAKAEMEERQKKQKEMERLERLEEKKRLEDERIKQENQKKQRIYAERIAKLSPEDRKKFIEFRKMRKINKRKQQQERYSKRLIDKINRNKKTINDY